MRTSLLMVALAFAVAACDDASTAPKPAAHDAKEAPSFTTVPGGFAITDATIRKYVPNAPPLTGVARLKQELAVPQGTLPVKVTDPWSGEDFGIPIRDCTAEYIRFVQAGTVLVVAEEAMEAALATANPVAVAAAASALAVAIGNYEYALYQYQQCELHHGTAGGGTTGGGTGGGSAGGGGSGGGDLPDLGDFNCTTKLNIKTCVPVRQ